jgi:hypothetical protein
MDHDIDTTAGVFDGHFVADIALGPLNWQVGQCSRVATSSGQNANLLARRNKNADDVVAQEARRTGYEVFHRRQVSLVRGGVFSTIISAPQAKQPVIESHGEREA